MKQNFQNRLNEVQIFPNPKIETPPEIVKQMEKMIYNIYFFYGKVPKVTRRSVINTLENGGLNLTDLELHSAFS